MPGARQRRKELLRDHIRRMLYLNEDALRQEKRGIRNTTGMWKNGYSARFSTSLLYFLFRRFRFEPAFSYFDLNLDRYGQRGHILHQVFDIIFGLAQFFGGHFKYQFIVNLQDHARFQVLFSQCVLDSQHGDFDQVGVAALDGHVDSFAFKRLSLVVAKHMHVGEEALAPVERVDVTLLARLVERAFDVVLDAREGFVIAFDELGGVAIAHTRDLRQPEGRLTVEHGVDDGFGQAALIFCDLVHRNVEKRGGGDAVNIFVVCERLD